MSQTLQEVAMRSTVKLFVVPLAFVMIVPLLATAASIRNVYFSTGELVPGQRYAREEQLPSPTTTFTKGAHKVARLFVVFGDLDAHQFAGQLKASNGVVMRRFDRKIEAVNQPSQWRVATQAFSLENLKPGDYTLDLVIDGEPKGDAKFTLRAP